jgi:chaperonin GroES
MSTATKAKKKPLKLATKLQPLGDRVVVEREDPEEVTAGGIVLPDTARDKPARGTVIAIGNGKLSDEGIRAPMQVKVGDRVLFTSYAPQEIRIGEDTVLLMSETDIMAVFED